MEEVKISKEAIGDLMDIIEILKDEVKKTKYGFDWLMVTIKHLEKRLDALERKETTKDAKVVLRPGREL